TSHRALRPARHRRRAPGGRSGGDEGWLPPDQHLAARRKVAAMKRLPGLLMLVTAGTPQEFAAVRDGERSKWARAASASGAKVARMKRMLLFGFALVTGTALAQDYPVRPVQMIVGYGPGGGTDILARVIAVPLARILGQPVVVRNVPGAAGQIAASALLR